VAQVETLRKMLLAMASDMRVVLVRLASCVTTLRYFAEIKLFNEMTCAYGRETLDLYAPLANRLGIWQLKWELEDLSFRFIEPDTYKRIAKMLEEKRMMREGFVTSAIARLQSEMAAAGIQAEVFGRPKHIYSIWNKMRGKELDFTDLYDVRAFRVIVDDVKTCYTVLGVVHNIWTPIPKEFDDYISRPKPNGYQSLHTVVTAEDGRPLEVQIRTRKCTASPSTAWRRTGATRKGGSTFTARSTTRRSPGCASCWRGNRRGRRRGGQEEQQREWVEKLKSAALDDRIFVLTPQARVIELPVGATPVDFAYHLHSDVGHRCRGARVDGVMVPLNTPLKNGQTCEIITAKGAPGTAGPSRDWLSDEYTVATRTAPRSAPGSMPSTCRKPCRMAARWSKRPCSAKARRRSTWSAGQQAGLRQGRRSVPVGGQGRIQPARDRAGAARQRRAGRAGRRSLPRQEPRIERGAGRQVRRAGGGHRRPDDAAGQVLQAGAAGWHRRLRHARQGRVHPPRDLQELRRNARQGAGAVIVTEWGVPPRIRCIRSISSSWPVTVRPAARYLGDLLARKINVIGVNTQSAKGFARMTFTAEIGATAQLQSADGHYGSERRAGSAPRLTVGSASPPAPTGGRRCVSRRLYPGHRSSPMAKNVATSTVYRWHPPR
jgi:GTP pyrophosphokinase